MIRSAVESLLVILRLLAVLFGVFLVVSVGLFSLRDTAPVPAAITVLLTVALAAGLELRKVRRWRHAPPPDWLEHARWYYSEIGEEKSAHPVSVFDLAGMDEVNSESPGTLYLRLEASSLARARVRVLDATGCEQGIIRSEGLVPGVRYAMRRNGELVWKLSVRSIVRRRHTLTLAIGDSWTIDTPFFWWQGLTGCASDAPRLLGGVVWEFQSHGFWAMWIDPGWDTFDLLAAVAFLHRQYVHW